MFENKKCEKCGKILPIGYEKPLCLNCSAKKDAKIKKNGVAIAGGAAAVGGIILAIIKGLLKE